MPNEENRPGIGSPEAANDSHAATRVSGPLNGRPAPGTPGSLPDANEPVKPLEWLRAIVRADVAATARAEAQVDILPVVAVLASIAPAKAQSHWGGTGRRPRTEEEAWNLFASAADLAELTGKGARTVERALAFLKSAGWLILTRRGGFRGQANNRTANEFRLAIPTEPATRGGFTRQANTSPVAGSPEVPEQSEPATRARSNPPPVADQEEDTPREGRPPLPRAPRGALALDPAAAADAPTPHTQGPPPNHRPRASEIDPWTADGEEQAGRLDDGVISSNPILDAEGVDVGHVLAVAAARGGRWDARGVQRVADQLADRYGPAEALSRLLSAAADPQANTPVAATWDRHGRTAPPTIPGERCEHCGQYGREACEHADSGWERGHE